MGSNRQKKLAEAIILNAKKDKPDNKTVVLERVGYTKNAASSNAKAIIESPGVQEELKNLGFDEDAAKRVVGNILNDKKADPNPRLKAADMIFKVHGSYYADRLPPVLPTQVINFNILSSPQAKQLAEQMDKIVLGELYEQPDIKPAPQPGGQIGQPSPDTGTDSADAGRDTTAARPAKQA